MTACPFDFLAHATGALRVHPNPELAVATPPAPLRETMVPLAGHSVSTVVGEGCNLHAIHRVLRI
jgi:hypothetical protein